MIEKYPLLPFIIFAGALISTATIFCLLGKSWPNALNDATSVFQEASSEYLKVKSNLPKEELIPGLIDFLRESRKRSIKLSSARR